MAFFVPHPPRQAGFSLIVVSLLLLISSIVFVSVLPGQDAADYMQKMARNTQKLEKVEEAMRSFMTANGRRPCPADGQYVENTTFFGIEADDPGICTDGLGANGIKAPFGPDAASGWVVGGAIPTKTLGLDDSYAFDEFGRRFTYVVDRRATQSAAGAVGKTLTNQCSYVSNSLKYGSSAITNPAIIIKSATGGTVLDHTMYAYISHGGSGYGAYPPQGGTVRINSGSNDADMITNSSLAYGANSFTSSFVKKDRVASSAADTGFDELLWYRPDLKNTCCLGASCQPKGFIAAGVSSSNQTGAAVAVGDVNGDGIADLIIGAPGGAGKVYVVFGTRIGFPDPLPLSSLNGSNGFELDGAIASGAAGYSVATGDINGDGVADIIIGTNAAAANRAYVVFGGNTAANNNTGTHWTSCPCSLTSGASGFLNGTNGMTITGPTGGMIGSTVSSGGDINGDGIADLAISDTSYSSNKGTVYVLFGQPGAWTNTVAIAGQMNGAQGTQFIGSVNNSYLGSSVAMGDMSGLGVGGLAIGVPGQQGHASGAVYVVFGKTSGWGSTTSTTLISGQTPLDGSAGIEYDGSSASGNAGNSVAFGDVNGDGMADLIIGAPTSNSNNGSVYVVFGKTQLVPSSTTINTTNGSTSASVGSPTGLLVGQKVISTNIPVNIPVGTTITAITGSNITLSAPATFSASNTTLLISGQPLSSAFLTGAPNGSEYDGTGGNIYAGSTVASGDINGDGAWDILIGANKPLAPAAAYAVFGRTSGWPTAPQALTTGPGNFLNGYLNGSEFDEAGSGSAAVAAGDMNGDGVADLVIGASNETVGSGPNNSGAVYVYYGHRNNAWPSSALGLSGL